MFTPEKATFFGRQGFSWFYFQEVSRAGRFVQDFLSCIATDVGTNHCASAKAEVAALDQKDRRLERKSSDGIAWGSSGKDARFLGKLRRLLGKSDEQHRKLILLMAQKMALR